MNLDELADSNKKQIHLAGPRYTPIVDPNAPNLGIDSLLKVFDALAFTEGLGVTLRELRTNVADKSSDLPETVTRASVGRKYTPQFLVELLHRLEQARPDQTVDVVRTLTRATKSVTQLCDRIVNSMIDQKRRQEGADEAHRRLEFEISTTSRLRNAVREVHTFVESPSCAALTNNSLLLLGEWGTGKTHFLCDLTQYRMKNELPTLLVLAQRLPANDNPLDAVCEATAAAETDEGLLSGLEALGEEVGGRSLLLIDGINESDRSVWRGALPDLARRLCEFPNVGLVLSCRRPFEKQVLTKAASKLIVEVEHPGFQRIEFDAQVEFFQFYNIPAPQVPLISPEFSRPLFLKLFCEAIKGLSKRHKSKHLRNFASGQRGMSHVIENFAKKVGRDIERDFKLPSSTCWRILKGEKVASGDTAGLAALMACQSRDYLTWNECLQVIEKLTDLKRRRARELARRMIADGLLTEAWRWNEGHVDVIQFPYQRFCDHLIARHLLEANLDTENETTIRHSLDTDQPLGKIFELMPGGHRFVMPGLAGAIILEFPERVKRVLPEAERELSFYLPKRKFLARALMDVFLDGLYWRSAGSFTTQTHRLVGYFLTKCGEYATHDTIEVLVGLACRPCHPYSAMRLCAYLERYDMAERDLLWSEYLRQADPSSSVVYRLLKWAERSIESGLGGDVVPNTILLLSLFLTTTSRYLRDRTTRVLFLLGLNQPNQLFERSLESLKFNDPYVPERMLAASYGVAMSLWADPRGGHLRHELPEFARRIVEAMFVPGAPYATRQVLMRDYALGVVELARKIKRGCISSRKVKYLKPPFSCLPSPFPQPDAITAEDWSDVEPALHMDFENYTIGRLIPQRGNYDYDHLEYRQIVGQILWRMRDLGYSHEKFRSIDSIVARRQGGYGPDQPGKTDRYGKKYSWIAFFEMYGVRQDENRLADWRVIERTSDCDIDPSFPEQAPEWSPPLADLFSQPYSDPVNWLSKGPNPRYDHLMRVESIDGISGPWVLLDGSIEESDYDPRRVFTSIRGLLVLDEDIDPLRERLQNVETLQTIDAPSAGGDVYTYAGEIPWSKRFGTKLRNSRGKVKRNIQLTSECFSDQTLPRAIRVEVPVHKFGWESYHSVLNQVSGVSFPGPSLCEALNLFNHSRTLDLFDEHANPASLYREFSRGCGSARSRVLYLREDLLSKYLDAVNRRLVWVTWGERTLHYDEFTRIENEISDSLKASRNVHRSFYIYERKC